MNKLVTLSCVAILATAADTGPAAAQDPSAAQVAAQAAESVVNNCLVQSVAALANRVHILCTAITVTKFSNLVTGGASGGLSSGAVRYFAVENSVAANATALAVLSVATAAMQRNRSLSIVYRTNPKENPAGCNPGDCRRIVGVIMN